VGGAEESESDYEDENAEADEGEEEAGEDDADGDAALGEGDVDYRLHPHGVAWTPSHHQNVDPAQGRYQSGGFRIRSWGGDGRDAHEKRLAYEYFMKSFPRGLMPDILRETNSSVVEVGRAVTSKGEIIKVWGMRLSMILDKLSVEQAFCTTVEEGSAKVPANYHLRYGMSKDRFQLLERHLHYSPDVPDDVWCQVRALVDAFNAHRADELIPGEFLCVDECMSMWLGLEGKYSTEGCPAVTKIQRKPRGVGVELKSCADGESGVMLRLELMEGKKAMSTKEHADLGAGCGHILRLTKPWRGTGRTVVTDSAFASVLIAVWSFFYGFFFMGIVKTATRRFPKKYLVDWFEESEKHDPKPEGWRGSHMCLYTEAKLSDYIPPPLLPAGNAESVRLFALCWADRRYKNIISTRGTTLPGTMSRRPRHRIVQDEHGVQSTQKYYKEVKRPEMVEMLFKPFPTVDIHDHFRQGTLAIEEEWRTHVWWKRPCSTVHGIIYVDAYFFMRFAFLKRNQGSAVGMESLADFLWRLVFEMVHNEEDHQGVGMAKRARRQNTGDQEQHAAAERHTLKPLHDLPYYVHRGDNRPRRRCWNKDCKEDNSSSSHRCAYFCVECSPRDIMARDPNLPIDDVVVYCGPTTDRTCFLSHLDYVLKGGE
jgi:hypothetical protein